VIKFWIDLCEPVLRYRAGYRLDWRNHPHPSYCKEGQALGRRTRNLVSTSTGCQSPKLMGSDCLRDLLILQTGVQSLTVQGRYQQYETLRKTLTIRPCEDGKDLPAGVHTFRWSLIVPANTAYVFFLPHPDGISANISSQTLRARNLWKNNPLRESFCKRLWELWYRSFRPLVPGTRSVSS
jgi:hypothetical protein